MRQGCLEVHKQWLTSQGRGSDMSCQTRWWEAQGKEGDESNYILYKIIFFARKTNFPLMLLLKT